MLLTALNGAASGIVNVVFTAGGLLGFSPAEGLSFAFLERGVSQTPMSQVQRATAVEKLFPPGVIAFEIRGTALPDDLFPSERECVARSVDKRVSEFAAGRLCARAGLTELGLKSAPLLPGPDRAPIWPSGIVGSITHTDNYCVAVVGLETQFAAIGVDAERIGHVSPSLWQLTMRAEEIRRLQSLDDVEREQMATVIFSAKEAFYKCQHALTRSWLGFQDVTVDIAGDAFEASVVGAAHPIHPMLSPWIGRFNFDESFVVAGISARPHPLTWRQRMQPASSPG